MSKNDKTFYRMKLCSDCNGLEVRIEKWISVRETPCFHFCVPEHWAFAVFKRKGESIFQLAKTLKILKRISKGNSRFAFESEEEALDHLKMLKRKQLHHMKRDSDFINKFLSAERFEKQGSVMLVPESSDLVNEYLCFDC